jgi:glycerophosphoryl diester phosphodiesterase
VCEAPHPQSIIDTPDGRHVELKIHQCVWSGESVPNSLPAVLDCYRAHVARAEIDIAMLRDADFLVVHDLDLAQGTDGRGQVDTIGRSEASHLRLLRDARPTAEHAPLLSDVIAAVAAEPYPTLLELDVKDWKPWPWPRVEELARLVETAKDRVTFGGQSDANLRRLGVVDPSLHVGYTLPDFQEWRPETPGRLVLRFEALLDLVPAARELHLELEALVSLIEAGLVDCVARIQVRKLLVDVWTINAGTPAWEARLGAALRLGADILTTETPRELVREASAAFARYGDDV